MTIKRKRPPSDLEETLAFHLNASRIPFQREYRFAAESVGIGKGCRQRLVTLGLKDWRFDFLLKRPNDTFGLAVECHGGAFINGGHTRGAGFHSDLLKAQAALRMRYIVYACDMKMIKSGEALETIQILLGRLN